MYPSKNYAVISWNKINERCTRKERIVLNALTSRWCSIPRFLSQHTFFWHVKHSLFSFITIFACHFISHATSLVRMTLFRISLNTEGKRFFFWSPSICICIYSASSYDTILVWEEFKWHDGRQVSFLVVTFSILFSCVFKCKSVKNELSLMMRWIIVFYILCRRHHPSSLFHVLS